MIAGWPVRACCVRNFGMLRVGVFVRELPTACLLLIWGRKERGDYPHCFAYVRVNTAVWVQSMIRIRGTVVERQA